MKIYKYISVIVLMTIITVMISCKKFLDVTPKTESPNHVMFDTETGFKDALSGVYIQIKHTDLYGMDLTFGMIEHLISSWDTEQGTVNQRINQHDYADRDVLLKNEKVFLKMYKAIANTNILLEKVDEKRNVFLSEQSYSIIKGEALALRAFIHLDLLRLYGPIPGTTIDQPVLPYVKTVTKSPHAYLDFNNYIGHLIDDLNLAESLLEDHDPIVSYSLRQLRNPGGNNSFNPTDTYFSHRALRLNYFAVKALKARAYLWKGDKENAYKYAKEVVETKNADGSAKFRLGMSSDISKKDFAFVNEHIWGLYQYDLADMYSKQFASGLIKKGSTADLIKSQLYGNTGLDIRESDLWEVIVLGNTSRCNIIKKYAVNDYGGRIDENYTIDELELKQIPMIRVSELYLILAETAPTLEAQQYWDDFLGSRNLPKRELQQTEIERKREITAEFRREFYGEGQAFYNYKRHNTPREQVVFMPNSVTPNYVLPLPTIEVHNVK